MGRWLEADGEAIYDSGPVEPFQEGKIAYTAKGDQTVFAIYLPDKDEKELPSELIIKTALKGKLNVLLPAFHQPLNTELFTNGLKVDIPEGLRTPLATQPALVIRIEKS